MAKLELKGVCKGFGKGAQRREVLKDIDLTIEDREIVAIVGDSDRITGSDGSIAIRL